MNPSFTNRFPAVLLAGPPHCGKSVLSFLLSMELRHRGVAHYLLRAAPDGEGDFFMEGDSGLVQRLRLNSKGEYSSEFVEHMRRAVADRLLPLLVDIGGKPQGHQLGILDACSHSVLLYRSPQEYQYWRTLLGPLDLLPLAELRSSQAETECIETIGPPLCGTIIGLEREKSQRKTGPVFNLLAEHVAAIFTYSESALEQIHCQQAPSPVLIEAQLAQQLGICRSGELPIWKPEHLRQLDGLVQAGAPVALYGRGPVWLAAFLATHALPGELSLFDARYGWLPAPPVIETNQGCLNGEVHSHESGADFWSLNIKEVLQPNEALLVPPVSGDASLIISGRLPRWGFAALARHFAPRRAWVAIDDPRFNRAIVIQTRTPQKAVGDVIAY